jgi:HK97 family phage major capsid protein
MKRNLEHDALLQEASSILSKERLSREDTARAEQLMALADRVDPRAMELRRAKLAVEELSLGLRSEANAAAAEVEREFRQYLIHGRKELLSDKTRMEMSGAVAQSRSQALGSGSTGGFIVPASFVNVLESSLIATDPIFAVATLFETETGTAFVHPEVDDQNAAATIVAENSLSVSGPDLTVVAGINWGIVPTWRSGHILASIELAQDSRFDLAGVIARASGIRLARGVGQAFITTLLSSAVAGGTAASQTAVTGDELISLVASLDAAYASSGSFCMNLSTYAAILKLKGTTSGDYLFPASTNAGNRPTLLGFPVYLSPAMPAMTANAKAITFGNHARFYRRQVQNALTVRVFSERYITSGQIGYESYLRVDGALMKAADYGSPAISQSPVKYLQMHS